MFFRGCAVMQLCTFIYIYILLHLDVPCVTFAFTSFFSCPFNYHAVATKFEGSKTILKMSELKTQSLSKQFQVVVKRAENFSSESKPVPGESTFDSILKQLKDIQAKVKELQLFSSNESLDEVTTADIKYLAIYYYLASFIEQHGTFGVNGVPNKRVRFGMLTEANQLYLQFLQKLDDYGLLDKKQSKIMDTMKDSMHPQLSEIQVRDPTLRRASKIANYKHEKEFQKALNVLNDKEALESMDDENLRNIMIDQLKFDALKSFESLESNLMELQLLKNYIKQEIMSSGGEDNIRPKYGESNDRSFDKGFTDRLENLNKPVLSKNGRILRPFTIVPSHEKRDQLRQKVQGTGQELPTMTVEDFVNHELKNGGMVAKSNKNEANDATQNEDDYEAQDKETYRQREFDDFKDYHTKGSGNMKGNMG